MTNSAEERRKWSYYSIKKVKICAVYYIQDLEGLEALIFYENFPLADKIIL